MLKRLTLVLLLFIMMNYSTVSARAIEEMLVIEPIFESAGDFINGYAFANLYDIGPPQLIDRSGKIVERHFPYEYYYTRYEYGWDLNPFIGEDKNIVYGLAHGCMANQTCGVTDREGNILPPPYSWNGEYAEGESLIFNRDGKLGIVDYKSGRIISEPKYNIIQNVSEGVAWAYVSDKYHVLIDKVGNEIFALEPEFKFPYPYSDGLALIKNQQYPLACKFIDKMGNVVIDLSNLRVEHPCSSIYRFSDGVAAYWDRPEYVYIDKFGQELFRSKYEPVLYFNYTTGFSNGLAPFVIDNSKIGYMDKSGKVVIEPAFDFADKFDDGLAIVQIEIDSSTGDRLYGVIDTLGNEVIPIEYDYIRPMSEGLFPVHKGDKIGFFDRNGDPIIPFQNKIFGSFHNGLAAVKIDGKYGYIRNPLDVPDGWANEEVQTAIDLQLVPISIDYGYKNNITRADFSKLVIALIEVKKQMNIDEFLAQSNIVPNDTVFRDTIDPYVLAANALGIVTGKGNDIFDPNGEITRQEAAVMLARTSKLLDIDQGESLPRPSITFSDNDKIAGWAKDAIATLIRIKDKTTNSPVMAGTGGNHFNPNSTFTKQQAFITIKRLYNGLLE